MAKPAKRTVARLHALGRSMEALVENLTAKETMTPEDVQAAMHAAGIALRALKMADQRTRKKANRW